MPEIVRQSKRRQLLKILEQNCLVLNNMFVVIDPFQFENTGMRFLK